MRDEQPTPAGDTCQAHPAQDRPLVEIRPQDTPGQEQRIRVAIQASAAEFNKPLTATDNPAYRAGDLTDRWEAM